jgi:hypothetical protein
MNYLNLFLLCILLSLNIGVNAAFQPQGVKPAERVVITENGENKSEQLMDDVIAMNERGENPFPVIRKNL